MENEYLLEIINQIDVEEKYFGIIPMYPVFNRAKSIYQLSVKEFHTLLLNLEKDEKIYLETINDINRLSIDEKKIAIYDQVRGYLYYIGLWK